MKLAPIADLIAAHYRARNADLTDPNIAEEILEDVRHEEPDMDFFAMDMIVGMVMKRLKLPNCGSDAQAQLDHWVQTRRR